MCRGFRRGYFLRSMRHKGEQLAQLMIDNNVGVTPVQNYEVKKIDSDYFTEE